MRKTLLTIALFSSIAFGQLVRGTSGVHLSQLSGYNSIPLNGLVAAYDFSEGGGSTFTDLTPGSAHSATISATPAVQWAYRGGAQFSTGTTYTGATVLQQGLVPALFPTTGGDFSIVTVQEGDDTGNTLAQSISAYKIQTGGAPPSAGFGWSTTGQGTNIGPFGDAGYWSWKSFTYTGTSSWIVGGASVSGTALQFYKGGVAQGAPITVVAPTPFNSQAAIGGFPAGYGGTNQMRGVLRFMLIYKRALTAEEHARISRVLSQYAKDYYVVPLATPQIQFPTVCGVNIAACLVSVPDNGLVRTPPMGWNSWNAFQLTVNERNFRLACDALVSTTVANPTLASLGYSYCNLDEWMDFTRDTSGNPISKAFPSGMAAIGTYVHGLGLKFGIYSSPGQFACAGSVGSYGWEAQDAAWWASVGVDYLKYDGCNWNFGGTYDAQVTAFGAVNTGRYVWQQTGRALQASGRPMVYSVNVGGFGDSGWFSLAGANLRRIGNDVNGWATFVTNAVTASVGQHSVSSVGHWNDPDMLVVGTTSFGTLTAAEGRSQFAFNSLVAGPLILGMANLASLTCAATPSADPCPTITNTNAIGIDQDVSGLQGDQAKSTVCGSATCQVWVRPLASTNTQCSGSSTCFAVGLFNLDSAAHTITMNLSDCHALFAGCSATSTAANAEIWTSTAIGTITTSFTSPSIASHDVFFFVMH